VPAAYKTALLPMIGQGRCMVVVQLGSKPGATVAWLWHKQDPTADCCVRQQNGSQQCLPGRLCDAVACVVAGLHACQLWVHNTNDCTCA